MSAKKYPLREMKVGGLYVLENAPKYFHVYARQYAASIGYVVSINRRGDTVTVKRRA